MDPNLNVKKQKNLDEVFKGVDEQDYSIFENQEDVAENIKKAAEVIGADAPGVDKIKDGKPLEFMVAKKSCKQCWGKGTIDFVPNKSHKVLKKKKSSTLNAFSPSHEYIDGGGRNTSLPENRYERRQKIEKALCKCVRIKME
jgi:hypothetical protein